MLGSIFSPNTPRILICLLVLGSPRLIHQYAMYYISKTLIDYEKKYTPLEKTCQIRDLRSKIFWYNPPLWNCSFLRRTRFLPLHSAGAGEFNDRFFSQKAGGIFRSKRLSYYVYNVPPRWSKHAHLNALFMKTSSNRKNERDFFLRFPRSYSPFRLIQASTRWYWK